jgi:hypothetical protein
MMAHIGQALALGLLLEQFDDSGNGDDGETTHPNNDARFTVADPVVEAMISSMTDCTAGNSHAELAQYCRQAVLKSCDKYEQSSTKDKIDGRLRFFEALKHQVQSLTPESLRSGANADHKCSLQWLGRVDTDAWSRSCLPARRYFLRQNLRLLYT